MVPILIAAHVLAGPVPNATAKDPHRPACTSQDCRRIKAYLKAHDCVGSPVGNGPADGCEIKVPRNFGTRISIEADWSCDSAGDVSSCGQAGDPGTQARAIALRELRRLGLPEGSMPHVYFTVWKAPAARVTLVEASSSHVVGDDLERCEVIFAIRDSSAIVVREVPFVKTDADKPRGTVWALVDVADVDDDGRLEIVLRGDAYEDHWLEVVRLEGESVRTIFSGLGSWL